MPRSGSQRRQRAARAARAARATPGQSGAASQRTLADILGNALVEARADEAAAVVARDNAAANLDLVLVLTRCLTTALHAASQMVRVATAAHESASSEQALAALNDALVVEMAARTAYKESFRALCNARKASSDAEAAAAAAGETTALLTIALRSAYSGELPALNHS
jgi:hypothetical protein